MVIHKIVLVLLCIISIISAITSTLYVKLLHEEHKLSHPTIENPMLAAIAEKKNVLNWINCVWMWFLSMYLTSTIYTQSKVY